MLKILDRPEILAELSNLFSSAHQEVIILSPFIRLNKKLKGF